MKRSPLRKMSTEKARATRAYWPLRRKFLEDHPFCEVPTINDPLIFTPSCMGKSVSIHHQKGQRGALMNDTRYWIATCASCHTWIEDHKNKAREMGLILY